MYSSLFPLSPRGREGRKRCCYSVPQPSGRVPSRGASGVISSGAASSSSSQYQTVTTPWFLSQECEMLMRRCGPIAVANAAASPNRLSQLDQPLLKVWKRTRMKGSMLPSPLSPASGERGEDVGRSLCWLHRRAPDGVEEILRIGAVQLQPARHLHHVAGEPLRAAARHLDQHHRDDVRGL